MNRYIAVIEDEPTVQAMLRDVFEAEGDTVLSIAHGGTALTLLKENPADLILVDLMLPDLPGTHVAAELRESGHEHTPMVAMSADHVNLVFARRSALFQEAIRKPFDIDELLGIVDSFAGRYVTQQVY